MNTTKRTIRLDQEDFDAFVMFFNLVGISGQRGKVFNAGLRETAKILRMAMSESVAAYEIAAGCASGEEWDELIEIIHPSILNMETSNVQLKNSKLKSKESRIHRWCARRPLGTVR